MRHRRMSRRSAVVIAIAAIATIAAVVAFDDHQRSPTGLTRLTTTTLPVAPSIWTGQVESDTVVGTTVAETYLRARTGHSPTSAIYEGGPDAVVGRFSGGGIDTEVYLARDHVSATTHRWLVTAAVSDLVTITGAYNNFGVVTATVTANEDGRVRIAAGGSTADWSEPMNVHSGAVIRVHQPLTGTVPTLRALLVSNDGRPALVELAIPPGVKRVETPVLAPMALFPSDLEAAESDRRYATAVGTATSWADTTLPGENYDLGPFISNGSDDGEITVRIAAGAGSTSTLVLRRGIAGGHTWAVIEVRSDRLRLGRHGSLTPTLDTVELFATIAGNVRATPGDLSFVVTAGGKTFTIVDRFFGTATVTLTAPDGTKAIAATLLR